MKRKTPSHVIAMILGLMIAGCSAPATDDSGASPSEARQLNEAASMLDNDSVAANMIGDDSTDLDKP
ncbi:hypothetical protein [Sphingomonas sp. 28-63-12]|uniref:hypothetical protein n=1 Tax=Sphingomonas sp. 28-63-12 TaxID=1970434 RepID=UPI000BCFEF99|nr:MAG: hypothetical protein B7Y47_08410 [Sphingomonas sp. 28-63-12]